MQKGETTIEFGRIRMSFWLLFGGVPTFSTDPLWNLSLCPFLGLSCDPSITALKRYNIPALDHDQDSASASQLQGRPVTFETYIDQSLRGQEQNTNTDSSKGSQGYFQQSLLQSTIPCLSYSTKSLGRVVHEDGQTYLYLESRHDPDVQSGLHR